MTFTTLVQLYFERSTALQGYWTLYVIVIGGVLGFSTFRQRPELVTTILVTVLYLCFAYKNEGAIEATAAERQAVLSLVRSIADREPIPADTHEIRRALLTAMPDYDVRGARYFHIACDLLTVAVVWAKEWRRRHPDLPPVAGPK
jgi:hypothetical protein